MNKTKKLAALFSSTLLVSTMFAASAFADTRHRDETKDQKEQSWRSTRNTTHTQQTVNSVRSRDRYNGQRAFNTTESRDRYDGQRAFNTRESRDRYDGQRGFNTTESRNRYDGQRTYNNSAQWHARYNGQVSSRYSYSGRVTRVENYHGGYRVWVGGAPYPFFFTAGAWGHWPIRVGLNVSFGGYYNPAYGYYNVYNYGPYGNPYAYQTSGDIRGLIQAVDYRRGTAVIRDDVSGSFITVALRGNDPRLGSLRPGDYADLSGSWDRSGVFSAFNVADLRPGNSGYGYDNPNNEQYPPQYPPSQQYPQ